MNQILQTENKKNTAPIEIKKIVKFFAIAIAIFAIILIGLGIYFLVSNSNTQTPENPVTQEEATPNVNITKQDDKILIEVTNQIAISKIVYNWNDEAENTIEGNNSTSLSETIDLPFGTNTLNLTVIDMNGKETKFQKEYVIDGDGKPVVELTLTKDYKIKITVQDSVGLKHIEYTWNNGEKTRIDANVDNLNLIEESVEIPLGQNTLTVNAVNTRDVITTKELEVKGVKRPEVTLTKDGDYLVIRAEDENAMKIVTYVLNGQRYQLNFGNKKVIEYRQELPEGESTLELTAENVDGGITEKRAKIIN